MQKNQLSQNYLLLPIQTLIKLISLDQSKQNIEEVLHTINTIESDTLFAAAYYHGLLPSLYHALLTVESQETDIQKILTLLKPHYMTIVHGNMLKTAELVKLLKHAQSQKIPLIPFKGPTLALSAYGDITLRQYGDLDILVKPQQAYEAASLLCEQGYTPHGSIDFLKDPVWMQAAKDMVFSHKKNGVVIELHWKLFHSNFANTDTHTVLWEETEDIELQKISISTLDHNILLAYLCIHGSRHLWERIGWIVDIDRLVRHTSIDWEKTLQTAKSFQSVTMLLLGLSLSSELFQTPLPKNIQHSIQNGKIDTLKQHILTSLKETASENTPTTKEIFLRKRIHAAMQDSIYTQILYWWKIIFQQNYTSMLAENEPNKYKKLTNLKRPFYLIKKFLFKS